MTSSNQQQLDPIAIIGIGCRFPGKASNPEKFWNMLCKGADTISEVPRDRWDVRRFYNSNARILGKMSVKKGGFLHEKWELFDAEFFQFSPREANFLDPQQRLLLELAWEAMEDGGIIPEKIRGSNTGVYIGAFTTDWQNLNNSPFNIPHCSMYSGINGSMTILSARLSYFFDLKGPSLTVDTACSSSLVSVHLACQSLWQNDCSLALAGGVNAMLIPETTIIMSKGQFLNPEGQCRSFDANAKGYVRGEGGGIVILKRFAEALRDKDPIYALIRGIGINHDGYTQGIAKPNPLAQQILIQKVLNESSVKPSQIHYVEAHGTGTPVGDPIEAMALNHVLQSEESREHPCYLGAVKTNMGHLEAAAGIAGLIKTALCLWHRKIPPNLHFDSPNPNIPFEKYCLKIPTTLENFPSPDPLTFASVNSFGYGGTNAHAVLQSYHVKEEASEEYNFPLVFPLSAKDGEALKAVADAYQSFLMLNKNINLVDMAYTLSQKRSLFDYRAAISAQSAHELQNKLTRLAKGEVSEGCIRGKILDVKPRLAFVYTGMGPQWWGMGRQLIESYPIFSETILRCDKFLSSIAGWSLWEELHQKEENSRMEEPEIAQVANYAIQVSLTELLRSWGFNPDAVVGHSVGEVAAAYAAGALSLEDGILVSTHRSRIQSKRKGLGAMLAVGIGYDESQSILRAYHERVSIAAENSPNSVTLAGNKEDLLKISETLDKRNIFSRFLKVNIAYHSHQMDGLEKEVLSCLGGLSGNKTNIPLFSTVYGDLNEKPLDANYWWQNIRQPVLFSKTLKNMLSQDYTLFVEIGPHPVLGNFIKEGLLHHQIKGETLASLNRKSSDVISLMECIGGLFVHGFPIPWDKVQPNGHLIRLPTYPWQKKAYWIESEESKQYRLSSQQHPLLSRKIKSPHSTWQVEVNPQHFPWLEDHKIDGSIVFPAAAYVEAGLAIHGHVPCILEDIDFQELLTIQQDKEALLQISLDAENKKFKVHSFSDSGEWEWIYHASGLCAAYDLPQPPAVNLETLQQNSSVAGDSIYLQLLEQGLEYGPYFQGIKKMWKCKEEALSEIHIRQNLENYHLHPALLDSALQTLIGALDKNSFDGGLILPLHMDQVIFFSSPKNTIFCHAHCTKKSKKKIVGDLLLCDAAGNVHVQIKGFQCRILKGQSSRKVSRLIYHSVWKENSLDQQPLLQDKPFWLVGFYKASNSENFADCLNQKNMDSRIYSPHDLRSLKDAEQLIRDLLHKDHLHVLLGSDPQIPEEKLEKSEIESIEACVHLVKAIELHRMNKPTTLWIATQKTQSVSESDHSLNLSGAALWGLGRVIRQEYPYLRCRLIDLDGEDFYGIIQETVHQSIDDEMAWRDQKRYTHQFKKKQAQQPFRTAKKSSLSSPDEAFTLDLHTPGLIESLFYKQIKKEPPSIGEVGVQVHASSLNFKDLMKVLGLLDQNVLEDTYFGESFGMECSGTIVARGPKVKNYQIGDKVCCFVPNTFQSYINVSTQHIFAIPHDTSLDEAPVYIPFLTVLRALKDSAKLKKGETILIHSATGAVGLAAIQYAQFVGANVIATAGNEEKRAYLHHLGVQNCSDSRSLSFVNDVKQWTEGRGVDVVLNSLSGEALTKSWSLLAPHGRFIEIGKRDISANNPLPMLYFNRNTSFAAIDLDRTFKENPQIIQRLLKEASLLFKQEVFKSLPCKNFPAHEAVEAFQFMARSKHMGKIMLNFANQKVEGLSLVNQKTLVNPAHSYLITGGLSGFGLIIAKWLVDRGAKYLILIGRRGAASVEAQEVIQELLKRDVIVKVAAVDVTHYDQTKALLADCEKEMPPLKGIIHSAMVLNDAWIAQLTPESIRQVLRPKIGGCINLHRLTLQHPLDFFVLFSSISSLIGNPGQGNYAAANAFLDSFCHYRKYLGLPALTLNWGALNMGVLTRNNKIAKHLEAQGIHAIAPKEALQVLEQAILSDDDQLCALDVHWNKIMQTMPSIHKSSVFADFRPEKNLAAAHIPLIDELHSRDENSRLAIIANMIKKTLADTLKMDQTKLEENVRLNTLGVDSLMAMELQTTLELNLGVKIPTMELMKGPTIKQLSQLTDRLLKDLDAFNRPPV